MTATEERAPWQVSVHRTPDSAPSGAGLLATPGHVLTCAHVVRESAAPGRPEEPVYIRFQHAPEHEPIRATVVSDGWHPLTGTGTADIAVLELADSPPSEAGPAPLRTTGTTWDHRFRVYGYPREHRDGIHVRGEINGRAGREWLQMEAGTHGFALEGGFSGAAVWDMNTRGVIGMMVARDPVSRKTGVDRRTAYAVRVEVLARYWPPLAEHVRDTTREELRDRLERLLWIPLTEDGGIPRVDAVDPYDIGVSRSKYGNRPETAPYVPRHPQDGQLDAALAEARFVVLLGPAKAGKSRTLYEALNRVLPGARLMVPRPDGPDHRVLDDLSRLALPTGADPRVLWLDDLHRYLQPGGLDLQILDRLARQDPPVVVVATLPARQRAALTGMENDVGRVSRTVLGKARTVKLPSRLGAEGTAAARHLYPGEDFAERGIGELMVAAPALEQRFDDGVETCPAGWAVVKAATDWYRMGMTEPVPENRLRRLFDVYLAVHHPQFDADDALFNTGLEWAREPVAGGVALLHRDARPDLPPAYTGSPHLAEYLDGRTDDPAAAVPRMAWQHLADHQPAGDLLRSAYAALLRGETDVAEQIFERVARTTGEQDSAAWASLMLGEIHLYQGDFEEAATLLNTAATSGVEDVVPLAQVDLAGLLTITGDRDRARALLETAVTSRDAQVSQMAQVGLARLLAMQGESLRAERILEAVLAAGDTEVTSLARTQYVSVLTRDVRGAHGARPASRERAKPGTGGTARVGRTEVEEQPWALSRAVGDSIAGQITALASVGLGGILVNQGKLQRAEELLKSAADSGGYHAAPQAQSGLAELYMLQGRLDEAQQMLEAVLRSGHPLLVPVARVSLGIALLQRGDVEGALPLLREVAEREHPDQGPRAACALGEWHTAVQEPDTARDWLERAIASGHPDWSHTARVDLAFVLATQADDLEAGHALLTEVMDSAHVEQAPRAADVLGELLAAADRTQEAEQAYRAAIGSGHRDWTQIARINLAAMLAARDGVSGHAEELLREAARSGHPDQGPRAADILGDYLSGEGRIAEAEEAYRIAIDSGHVEWSLVARVDLAVTLADHGDLARAESLLRVVAESDNSAAVAWATALLGMVLVYDGRREEGMRALREAGRTDETLVARMAQVQLAKFLLEGDDDTEADRLLRGVSEDPDPAVADVVNVARAYLCVLLLRRGDVDAAQELLPGVEESGDSQAIAVAYFGMGEHLLEIGDVQAAGELLESSLGMGDPDTAPSAGVLLGVVRLSEDDLEEARRLLSDALATGEPSVEWQSRRYLGGTLFRMELWREAEETLLPLAGSEDVEHRPQALRLLAQVLVADDRPEEACRWFEQALHCGDPEIEFAVREEYAELLLSLGRRDRAREVLAPTVSEEADAAEPALPEGGGTAPAPVAEVPAPPQLSAHPLPAAVLTLLGDVAAAEGDETEAGYWYALAEGRPLSGA
ncbi:tetratricopeptide repeat protein [Streptomyces sviceus]|uniref:tetratricopeptide repeat protein n=1 Tax=Streptomyces sviceus TaxID=285530 RepID=UPI0033278190